MPAAIVGPFSLSFGFLNAMPGQMVLGWQGVGLPGGLDFPVSHLPLVSECAPQQMAGRVGLPPPAIFFEPGDP